MSGQRWRQAADLIRIANAKQNTYCYKNIDFNNEIRVLKVYHRPLGSEIICCLSPRRLTQPAPGSTSVSLAPYVALSYCWGSDDPCMNNPPSKIYFVESDEVYKEWEGSLPAMLKTKLVSCLLVGRSLEAALEAIRYTSEGDVFLWADALCINQKNLVERTAQVSRMHDVYTQAERVCIWLGTGGVEDLGENREEDHSRTFDFLRRILNLRTLDEVVARLEKKQAGTPWREDRKDCERFFDLMRAKWFSLRWIIQEVALARSASVLYGNCEMSWQDFSDAIALIMTKFDEIKAAFPEATTYDDANAEDRYINSLDPKALGANILVSASSNLFRKSSSGQIIQRLLSLELLVSSMLLAFEARDPRDTVFAVLQIAKDNYSRPPSASVRRSGFHKSATKIISYTAHVLFAILCLHYYHDVASTDLDQTTATDNIKRHSTTAITIFDPGFPAFIGLAMTSALSMIIVFLLGRMLIKSVLGTVDGPLEQQVLDLRIAPNYQKCLTDVCGDFIEYCIENSNSLDIICRHWVPKPKPFPEAGMPSWILFSSGDAFGGPAQARKSRVHGDSFVGTEKGRFYTASGNQSPAYIFGKMKAPSDSAAKEEKKIPGDFTEREIKQDPLPPRFNGILKVKGFTLGEIDKSEKITGPVISREAMKLCGWDKTRKASEGSDDDLDQVWRLLVANRGLSGIDNPPDWYRRACRACLEWYKEDSEEAFNISKLMRLKDTPKTKVEFLKRVEQVVYHRTAIQVRSSTGRKYRGLAPPKAQRRDIVCILYGCSVPVILSKRGDGTYQFLGESYIHGVMDGEAADPSFVGAKEKWFTLS